MVCFWKWCLLGQWVSDNTWSSYFAQYWVNWSLFILEWSLHVARFLFNWEQICHKRTMQKKRTWCQYAWPMCNTAPSKMRTALTKWLRIQFPNVCICHIIPSFAVIRGKQRNHWLQPFPLSDMSSPSFCHYAMLTVLRLLETSSSSN